MAYNLWSDIHHSIKQDGAGNIKTVTNVDSVLTSIYNILHTSPGERVNLPTFACSIKGMVFERMTPELQNFIAKEIKRAIEYWDNRVNVNSVGYSQFPDSNAIEAAVNVSIVGFPGTYSVSVTIGG